MRAQVHLPLHTAPELGLDVWVGSVLLYVHRNRRLIRDWSPGRPPRLSHSSDTESETERGISSETETERQRERDRQTDRDVFRDLTIHHVDLLAVSTGAPEMKGGPLVTQ